MDQLFSALSTQSSIDLKANGEVSRMRNHKGNMPSLPQTKYCPLCPAKFTRTTHLNRHLRSHTNERLHRCNICHAEFTRSDLLTRHKRTCGDSANANRSRRKSCQACAESKVKCNLHYPCSKCSSRGRECIFINDPEASRNKKNAAKRKPSLSVSPTSGAGSATSSPSSSLFPESLTSSPTTFPSTFPLFNPSTPISRASSLPFLPSVPSLVSPGSSSTSSLQSSPRSELFDHLDMPGALDMNFDAFSLETQPNNTFTDNLFDSFLDQSMTPCSAPLLGTTNDFIWPDGSGLLPPFGAEPFMFPQTHNYDDQGFMTDLAAFASMDSIMDVSPRTSTHHASTMAPATDPFFDAHSVVPHPQGPTNADLDHYLYLFFSEFCKQVPLVHPATWKMDEKPAVLVKAMQACGALFVKTAAAAAFIDEALASTRDTLIQNFAKATSDPREQNNLILTVVLLQTIGLFHQKADQRISSSVYHGMLVMMIRRTGLMSRVGAWTPPDLNDVQSLDAAWREWANYETIKRVLFISYIHDCCHCMYFSLSPSFQPSEIEMRLPCDNALWAATDAREWYRIVQAPSPYGTGSSRISGFSMKRALTVLGETRLSTVSLSLNPFAHFILIHTILRNIYASQAECPSGDASPTRSGRDEPASGDERDNAFATQYALHNWLQMWLNSPESMQLEKSQEHPPFVCDALPFYWLAQVSLLAIQDGTAIFGGKAEGRFRLMKEWLDHIRTFLRNGSQVPTHLWDELMKIRVNMSLENVRVGDDYHGGLLAFFPGR